MAPPVVAWKSCGSALWWIVWIGHEGRCDQDRRLEAEHKGLRARGLAVGSAQLPWARIQLATNLGLVKGRVGLGRDGVCSRGVKSSFDRHTRKPGIAVPSVARRRGDGGGDKPAGSIGGRATVKRNAGIRVGDTGVAAPSAGDRLKPRMPISQSRTRHVSARSSRPRVSAQPTVPGFFAAIVRGVKNTSHPRNEAPASGSVALPAVRRCDG